MAKSRADTASQISHHLLCEAIVSVDMRAQITAFSQLEGQIAIRGCVEGGVKMNEKGVGGDGFESF
jgi:hypothetical protein